MLAAARIERLRQEATGPNGIVAAVLIVGVAIRLAFVIDYRPAFLGIPDTGSYIAAARDGLFSNVYDPAGYPLFIRVLHAVDPHLALLIVVQHMLGVGTAALWYLAVRRLTGSALLALVPAVVVLFDGYELWVEHTPITETLFTFLVAGALYLAARAAEGSRWLAVVVGAVIGAAGIVRPIGFVLLVVLGGWMLYAGSGGRRVRLLTGAVLLAPGLAIAAGYVVIQQAETGFAGLTRDSGRVVYARAAQFADCARFTPPTGTEALCERTPQDRRGSFNQYLTGAPDHARDLTPASRLVSPAWRVYGPPPGGNSKLEAFGVAAITHQPLDYLALVASDYHYYWADDHRAFIAAAARVDPGIERIITSYYRTGAGVSGDGLGWLRWYGDRIEVTGVLMVVLLLAPLTALFADQGRPRRAAVLFALAGWSLPLASDAVASVDPRFVLPAYGPLAAAAAIGLGGARARAAAKRVSAGWRFQGTGRGAS